MERDIYDPPEFVRKWDMEEEYDEARFAEMWEAFAALPVGSVVATGFVDDGYVYFEKREDDWYVSRVDNPNVADVLAPGESILGDSATIDAGGDIERAYVIQEGPRG